MFVPETVVHLFRFDILCRFGKIRVGLKLWVLDLVSVSNYYCWFENSAGFGCFPIIIKKGHSPSSEVDAQASSFSGPVMAPIGKDQSD